VTGGILSGQCLLTDLGLNSLAIRARTTSSELLPFGPKQRVFDVAFLLALDVVRPGLVKRPHEAHARFLHHASRRDVHDHRESNHALNAKLGEALMDQRSRAFGGIPFPQADLWSR